jgi:uncharacterized protein YecE (DUF72 family)
MFKSDRFYMGTAGWTVPRAYGSLFPADGSHLERYARRFNAVEINSSFYREHQAKTYKRWAEAVPDHFRFSVKLSRTFTHDLKLKTDTKALDVVLKDVRELGEKLGVLLVQLPPKLEFDAKTAGSFLKKLRKCFPAPIAFEPRHPTWALAKARALFKEFNIAKVEADPEKCPGSFATGALRYFRLHGSPVVYRSSYEADALARYAAQIQTRADGGTPVWCIFDNTTLGFATSNAIDLGEMLR